MASTLFASVRGQFNGDELDLRKELQELFDGTDFGREKKPGSAESIQKAQNCQGCRCGYRRCEPYGKTVQRIQKDDEETSWNDGWQRWKKGQIQASLLTYK